MPETYWDPQSNKAKDQEFGAHYRELVTRDAAEQVRRNTLPKAPADVKLELPKDFQVPQGLEFRLDTARPEYAKLQQAAVKHGLTQDAVTDLMGVYAETLVGHQTTIKQASDAEVAKLGANGPARISTLQTFLTAQVGEDGAKALGSMMVTAGIVQAFEKLVTKFAGQGAASFTQQHRDTEPQGRLSDEQVARMSPGERLDYNRRFDQSKMPAWRDPRAA